MYKSDKLPEWYLQYVKQQEEELQKEEEAQELLDETERDIQREQQTLPLSMRLFQNKVDNIDELASMVQ